MNKTGKHQWRHTATAATVYTLLLGAVALTGCGSTAVQASAETASMNSAELQTTDTVSAETIDAAYTDDLDETYDFGGRDFNFMLYGDSDPYSWSEIDVLSEGQTGETINDGVYLRNLALEERMNIHITGEWSMSAASVINKTVQAGDSTYDAVFLRISTAGSPAQSGALYDFHDIQAINLEKSYWDSSIMRDLSIGGHIYFLTGDISTIDNQATWTLMFNKDMISQYDMESPYDLVRSGTWTIDKFSEMTKDISRDIDGDGSYTMADMYGLTTTADTIYGLFYSCGLTFIGKDEDDYPAFSLDTEKASSVLEKTCAIYNEGNRTLLSTKIAGETSDVISGIRSVFFDDRGLFYAEVMFHVANLRQMETDFGIIPMPKYDTEQEDYITFVNPAGSCLSVPITANAEESGIVLEAMASLSYRYLTPAYYDTALKGKYARDDESAEMLDLLLNNRVYDLALVYSWGNIATGYSNLVLKNSTDLSSLLAKTESKINTSIEKFVSSFENFN